LKKDYTINMVKIVEQLKNAYIVPITRTTIKTGAGEKSILFSNPDLVKEGFWIWKPKEKVIYITKGIIDAVEGSYAQSMTIGDLIKTIITPEQLPAFLSNFTALLESGQKRSFITEVKIKTSDTPVWIQISGSVNRYKNNRLKDISGIVEDISKTVLSEQKNSQLMKIQDALLDINHHMAKIGDLDKLMDLILNRITEAMSHIDCASFLTLNKDNYFTISNSVGYDPEAVKKFKLPYNELFFKKTTAEMYQAPMIVNDVHRIKGNVTPMAKTIDNIQIKSLLNTPIIIDNELAGIISLDSSRNYIFDEDDLEILQYIKEQIEIAISKYRMYEKIKFISRHDQLTGFINRSYFEELFGQNLKLAKRYRSSFSLVVMDLDGLKKINDNYGHMAGDLLITTFSENIKKYFRESDIFSRFGGDEFAGLFLAIKSRTLQKKFNDFTQLLISKPFEYNEDKIICSFSYGLAAYPKEGTTFMELFKLADSRMYKFKNDKRNNLKRVSD